MKIFSGFSNVKLAEDVSRLLNLPRFLPERFIFPDKEERIRITEDVVNDDAIIIQSLSTPVNENIIETCFIADALKRSGASKITLVSPYLGYQRQDHLFRPGEAVSLEVVIKMLEGSGIDKIVVFDPHSIKILELFKIPVVHLSAFPIFADKIKNIGLPDKSIIVSPDMGGLRRAKQLSKLLKGTGFAYIEKNRDLATGGVEVTDLEAEEGLEIKGKRACIVDDMISSGGTIVKAVEFLKKRGAEAISVFATHAVFSQNASFLLQNLEIDKVYATDSIFIPENKRFPKLEVLSMAGLIADCLKKDMGESKL